MKSRQSSWLIDLILILLYGIGINVLMGPWLLLFSKGFVNTYDSNLVIWFYLMVITGCAVGIIIKNFESFFKRFLVVVITALANILVLFLLRWPLFYHFPVFLLLLAFGLRFVMYDVKVDFINDFALGFIWLLLNLTLNKRFDFGLDYKYVLIFIVTGIIMSVLFSLKGGKFFFRKRKVVVAIILGLILSLILLSTFIGVLFDQQTLQIIFDTLGWCYKKLVELIVLILYPVIALSYIVFSWLLNLILRPGMQKERIQSNNLLENMELNIPAKETVQDSAIGHYILYVILALLVIYLVYRLRTNNSNVEEKGFGEERESIFTLENLKNDVKVLLESIKKRILKRRENIYDGSNPAIIIREIYYKFLVSRNKVLPFHHYYTPCEYNKRLQNVLGENAGQKEIKDYKLLTGLYNKARYGENADLEDVENAVNIWDRINKQNKDTQEHSKNINR